ncbi:MAG: TorD/DmsD family molecular chaperone [Ardenticatenaceae bacterium]
MNISLTTTQVALARHHTYMLLSRLYLEGLTEELLPYAQALPSLAATLPDSFEADEAAADYQSLFGFNLFPYESIFLDPSGLLGGTMTERVANDYRQAGFAVRDGESADHIGNELAFLGFLSGAEADAWEDNLVGIALRMRHMARDFLQTHLLRWLPPFIIALQRQPHAFYARLADLTLDVVTTHLSAPANDLMEMMLPPFSDNIPPIKPTIPSFLPSPPTLLTDENTSLKDIASYLISPPISGIYLARDDIVQLGRQQRLPRGFGKRQQILTNLLRVASQYDEWPTLLSSLQEQLEAWRAAYINYHLTHPHLAPFADVWLTRATRTCDVLEEMRRASGK